MPCQKVVSTCRKLLLTQLPADQPVWISGLSSRTPHMLMLMSPMYKPSFPRCCSPQLRSHKSMTSREIREGPLCSPTYSSAGQGSNVCRTGSALSRSLVKYWVVCDAEKRNTVSSGCVIKGLYWTCIFTEHTLCLRHLVALAARRGKLQSGYQICQPLPKDSQPYLGKKTERKKDQTKQTL